MFVSVSDTTTVNTYHYILKLFKIIDPMAFQYKINALKFTDPVAIQVKINTLIIFLEGKLLFLSKIFSHVNF